MTLHRTSEPVFIHWKCIDSGTSISYQVVVYVKYFPFFSYRYSEAIKDLTIRLIFFMEEGLKAEWIGEEGNILL